MQIVGHRKWNRNEEVTAEKERLFRLDLCYHVWHAASNRVQRMESHMQADLQNLGVLNIVNVTLIP